MKTKPKPTVEALRRAIARAGGKCEEDEGSVDVRNFQAVAPDGKLWAGDDLRCLLVQWAYGSSPSATAFNADALGDVVARMSYGLREMTEEEADLYAED